MKLSKIIFTALILAPTAFTASAGINVDKIDPPYWWTGMKDSSLQLQIHGKDIRSAELSVGSSGVRLDSVVRLDGSPDWQYVYLTVLPEAEPGSVKLTWKDGRHKLSRNFELRSRQPNRGAKGFDASDILYMVMPDRFADGDPSNNLDKSMNYPVGADRSNLNLRHGGDIQGIRDHIDYIDSLGVTTVWVNPVLENDMPYGSYHGYATTDYYRVDSRFGSNADYAAMISDLHNRGIKTVMDMIFNHCGSGHPWFENPPSSDWFNFQGDYRQTNYRLSTITDPYASDYDKSLTVDGWFVREMPDLNQRNPHLMKYLIQNSIFWIEDADIDGIRMDTYPYADKDSMAQWIDAVMAEYPDFNIVGECWFGSQAGEAYWQKGSRLSQGDADTHLPVVMDFPLMIACRDLAPFKEETDPWNGLNKIYDHLALDYVYANPLNVMRFLDNHDTERVLLEVPDNLNQWRQAVALLLTIPGIPQLYYGTELLMSGDRKPGDGNVRRDMPGGFPGDTENVFDRSGRTDLQNEAFDFISCIAKWRKKSKAIALGDMKHFMPTNGVYLYSRTYGDDNVVVILNGVDKENKVDMSRYEEIIPVGKSYRDVLSGKIIVPVNENREFTFAPREVLILQSE
jgi:glycosidase